MRFEEFGPVVEAKQSRIKQIGVIGTVKPQATKSPQQQAIDTISSQSRQLKIRKKQAEIAKAKQRVTELTQQLARLQRAG